MKNFETLEVGKTYKNRNGELVKIIKKKYDDKYPYYGDNNYDYTLKGFYWDDELEDQEDLIELIENKPLTICEIDAKIAELQELRKELDKSVEVSDNSWQYLIDIRVEGEYAYKAFVLHRSYKWELLIDSFNISILVPTKK